MSMECQIHTLWVAQLASGTTAMVANLRMSALSTLAIPWNACDPVERLWHVAIRAVRPQRERERGEWLPVQQKLELINKVVAVWLAMFT